MSRRVSRPSSTGSTHPIRKAKLGRPPIKAKGMPVQWYRWARDYGLSRTAACAVSGLTYHQGRLQDAHRATSDYEPTPLPAGFTAEVIGKLTAKEQRMIVQKGGVRSRYVHKLKAYVADRIRVCKPQIDFPELASAVEWIVSKGYASEWRIDWDTGASVYRNYTTMHPSHFGALVDRWESEGRPQASPKDFSTVDKARAELARWAEKRKRDKRIESIQRSKERTARRDNWSPWGS